MGVAGAGGERGDKGGEEECPAKAIFVILSVSEGFRIRVPIRSIGI